MSLPTIQEIVANYLYGSTEVPNLVDDSLIADRATKTVEIDVQQFMVGPGRFALGSRFQVISEFFTSDQFSGPIDRSLSEIIADLGLADADARLDFHQADFDDGSADYVERSLIWGSTGFTIDEGARFVVDASGNRSIEI